MNVLIVYCHPEPQSFNAALKNIAVQSLIELGHEVDVCDLYAEGFDPVEHPRHYQSRRDDQRFLPLNEQRHAFDNRQLAADIDHQIARLQWADLVILQFPLWWHAQPAMLKGWFDRVMVYGGLYSGSRRYDRGVLRGKRAICSVTTGSPEAAFGPFGRGGDISRLMYPIHCSLYYLGFEVLPPQLSFGVQGGGLSYQAEDHFQQHLETLKDDWQMRLPRLESEAPIPFSGWDDWDEQGVLGLRHPQRWL
ncbi:NAD(P)H-dependent oxidoreductase [Halomonas huangheensis]|uniref:Flavodoxin-like fold domain-containing protein n=1 Tax=Halomonas huangheensis TaxID=1178482 RepID=W1NAC0_9GAMM|nr:NAD(P)H-dependent oxidoreductase [Halomonas huangheensis]ALM53896.1 NADPH quinone oxidoreductase [Halomonas huangheensis]ERL52156.1 hypothetical protein BJB45_09325 [Halomonas huangheensis]